MKLKPEFKSGERKGGFETDAMIHESAAAWVGRRDAGLDADAAAELEAWLAADPRHRTIFAEYGATWAVLDRPTQSGVAEDVLGALGRLDRRRHRRRRALSGGIAAAVLLAGVSLWMNSGERRDGANPEIAATARVLVPDHRTLPDGTLVELKEGSEIVPDFGARYRRVALLRGDAYFRVAKDAARPFVVEANGVEFRAVGTAFSVQLGDEEIEIIVTEGRVAVEKAAAPDLAGTSSVAFREPPETLLNAGERAVIGRDSNGVKVQVIARDELSERLAWRAPRLEFTGTPLSEVVALLNQHAAAWQGGARFLIEDSEIAQVRVSGLFRADKTEALLDLLDSGFGIKAERRGESEIVLRKAAVNR